jgi:hypothetical protein
MKGATLISLDELASVTELGKPLLGRMYTYVLHGVSYGQFQVCITKVYRRS